jgi:zinc-binding alcohol dehydrogenase family protein
MLQWRVVAGADGAPVFEACRVERPVPAGADLLVRVAAVSVNPVDVKTAHAWAAAGRPGVAGWDAAGVVVASGPDAAGFGTGDPVYFAGDLTRPGSNAELQLVDHRLVGHRPASLGDAQAAAMPLTTLTAWEALHERFAIPEAAGAATGRRLLVVNGAGGVGSIAIQLARRLGLAVVATAGRAESRDWCLGLGADSVIGHDALAGQPADSFDYILCAHDTDRYLDACMRLVAPLGAICLLTGARRAHDIQPLMRKSATLASEFMFTRSGFRTPDMARQGEILTRAAALFDAGALRHTMTRCLSPLGPATLAEAHGLVASGRMRGKLSITLGGTD